MLSHTTIIYFLTILTCKKGEFMTLVEIRSATITDKGQISIPREIRKNRFKKGSKVAILAFTDHIEIRPMDEVNMKMMSAFASEKVLGKDWNTKEEEKAWKNL